MSVIWVPGPQHRSARNLTAGPQKAAFVVFHRPVPIARLAIVASCLSFAALGLSGCLAAAAGGAVVGTAVAVTGAAVGVTAKGVGAAAGAVIPDGDKKKDKRDDG